MPAMSAITARKRKPLRLWEVFMVDYPCVLLLAVARRRFRGRREGGPGGRRSRGNDAALARMATMRESPHFGNPLSPRESAGVRAQPAPWKEFVGGCFPLTLPAGRSLRETRPAVAAGAEVRR